MDARKKYRRILEKPEEFSVSPKQLEDYKAGKLSPAEERRMEEAILHDPFLNDAAEGWTEAESDESLSGITARLNKRIDEKTDEHGGKLVFFGFSTRQISAVAASLILLITAGSIFWIKGFEAQEKTMAMESSTLEQKEGNTVPTAEFVDAEEEITDKKNEIALRKEEVTEEKRTSSENFRENIPKAEPKKTEQILSPGAEPTEDQEEAKAYDDAPAYDVSPEPTAMESEAPIDLKEQDKTTKVLSSDDLGSSAGGVSASDDATTSRRAKRGNSKKGESFSLEIYWINMDYKKLYKEAKKRTLTGDDFFYAGASAHKITKNKEAVEFLKTFIEKLPGSSLNREARWYLANAQLEAGNRSEAVSILKKLSGESGEFAEKAKKKLEDI